VIQGGDGGMEYGMCTLITGERKFGSLVGVTAHELAHSWFQFVLATHEGKHEWMDEGFTDYISTYAMNEVMEPKKENPLENTYKSYFRLAASGLEQPQSTHADRYNYNFAYGASAYSKGAVFLAQLGYIMGDDNLKQTLKTYYKEWAFKHPAPMDFINIAETVSGLNLDWYLIDWTQTTNTIDYGIKSAEIDGETTQITFERIGLMPMPIDFEIEYTDGTKEQFYIPLRMMRGQKPTSATVLEDWAWAQAEYGFKVSKPVKSIVIDPMQWMADINRVNNTLDSTKINRLN
jgi:aminopeptidase N